MVLSSENQTIRVGSRTLILLMTPSPEWSSESCMVGVASRSGRVNNDYVRFRALLLVGSSASASKSNNVVFTES